MVVFDSVVLTLLLNEHSDAPEDPATKQPIYRAHDRIGFLVDYLAELGEQILIPTPVLSEVLVVAGSAGLQYVHELQQQAVFEIRSFDTIAAIQLAQITKAALDSGDKKSGVPAPWQLIKIDRQIVAIASAAGAHRIYTNDDKMRAFAYRAGIEVVPIQDLPLPPEPAQMTMDFVAPVRPPPGDEPDEAEINLATELDASEGQEEEAERQPEGPVGTVPPSGTGA
jgi:predicted nucleic acid-binding protein